MMAKRKPGIKRDITCPKCGEDNWKQRDNRRPNWWSCNTCVTNAHTEAWRKRQAEGRQPTLPVDPLVSAMGSRLATNRVRNENDRGYLTRPTSARALFLKAGYSENSNIHSEWSKAKRRGWAGLKLVEDVCYLLDLHPRELYGDEYDRAGSGGILPPGFVKTADVDRATVAAVRNALAHWRAEDDWTYNRGPRRLAGTRLA